ncbi:hypothetical protein ACFQZS_08730 [Mucilaginibacter calamicampi]|uniref:Glycosyltransferase RgtA/B/C/D-like domain-containing protein n=1 Tax=Mucilaginibacter calamicampi TaxID=1302352 RepID=A0ABW2YXU6_9SPHI
MPLAHSFKNIDSVIAAVAGFFIIQLYTAYSGIGVSPDSIMYASAGRSLVDEGALITFNGLPLVDFPVFYPTFLASVIFITGIDPFTFGPVLNGLMFATLLYLCGWIMQRFVATTHLYKCLVLVAIILSPALLQIYTYLWSETLFILLSIVFMVIFRKYMATRSIAWLLAAALVASVSTVTRYAGVTIIGTGGFILLFDRNLDLRRKIIHILNYGLMASSLLILNLMRNALLTKTMTGPREPSLTPFTENVYYFGTVIAEWLHIAPEHYAVVSSPLAWLVLLTLAGLLVYQLIKGDMSAYENVALTFALIYGLFIIISSTFSRYERINPRLLSPMVIPLIWSLTNWVLTAFRNIRFDQQKRRIINSCFCLLMLVFIANEAYADWDRHHDQHDYGNPGYTDDEWNNSKFVTFLENNKHIYKPGVPIYSDANEAAYFTSGIRCKNLPHRFFPQKIAEFYKVPHYYLIWFEKLENPELINLEHVMQRQKLVKLYDFGDEGAVYEMKPELNGK